MAAGFEGGEDVAHEALRVREEGADVAAVDVIERVSEDPLVVGVVDLEAAVGRDVFGLDRGEVGAEDVGFGMSFRWRWSGGGLGSWGTGRDTEINGPDAGTGPDVQDALRFVDRCEVQFSV